MPDIAKVILEYELKREKWRVRGKARGQRRATEVGEEQ